MLAFAAVFLQIAVFLQSLLPEKYQVSPVCETIVLVIQQNSKKLPDSQHITHPHHLMSGHDQHRHHDYTGSLISNTQTATHHHHDAGHQCQYCVVYSHILPLPDIDIKHILIRLQVRFVAFQQSVLHVYFELQRLYLLPQGRAPPTLLLF